MLRTTLCSFHSGPKENNWNNTSFSERASYDSQQLSVTALRAQLVKARKEMEDQRVGVVLLSNPSAFLDLVHFIV